MRRLRILYVLIGAVLLLAAGLKTLGFAGANAVPPEGILRFGWFQALVVYLEILAGAWLLRSGQAWLKWFGAAALFTLFLAANLWFGWHGQASCGCFGPVQTDPRLVAGFDAVVLVLLALLRPASPLQLPRWSEFWHGGRPPATTAIGLGILATIALGVFGSWDHAVAFLQIRTYSLTPSNLDLGSAPQGEVREAEVRVSNWSGRTLHVVGGTATCSCLTTLDLPRSVPPGESTVLRVHVKFPDSSGRFRHHAKFILDADGWVEAPFHFTGYAEP